MSAAATRSRDIASNDWPDFCARISRHYAGRIVQMRLLGPELGVFSIARGLPFIGITFEPARSGQPAICVTAGDLEAGHVSHEIIGPRSIRIRQEANGVDNAIQIEAAGSPTLLIEFAAENATRT